MIRGGSSTLTLDLENVRFPVRLTINSGRERYKFVRLQRDVSLVQRLNTMAGFLLRQGTEPENAIRGLIIST
jgi:hypothetical protein